jgi:hypothetical protein
LSDVLQFLFSEIGGARRKLSSHMDEGLSRDADSPRVGYGLKPCCDVYAVTVDAHLIVYDIAYRFGYMRVRLAQPHLPRVSRVPSLRNIYPEGQAFSRMEGEWRTLLITAAEVLESEDLALYGPARSPDILREVTRRP